MSDRIRYAFGHSVRGDFVAAMSDRGLVAFEHATGTDVVGSLLRRFPDAILVEDSPGLAITLATLAGIAGNSEIGLSHVRSGESAPVLGIITSSNRLVRRNGSLAGGRACAASVHAAARHFLSAIPRLS